MSTTKIKSLMKMPMTLHFTSEAETDLRGANSIEQNPSSEDKQWTSNSRNSSPITECESLLPCSQVSVTGPCPESVESSPHPHNVV